MAAEGNPLDGLDALQLALLATENAEEAYNSEETCNLIIEHFMATFNGKAPYKWQVDVTQALILKRDVVVIASTGAGKTMPFCMPLLINDTKMKKVLIISPLNELEEEQVSMPCYIKCLCHI